MPEDECSYEEQREILDSEFQRSISSIMTALEGSNEDDSDDAANEAPSADDDTSSSDEASADDDATSAAASVPSVCPPSALL